MELVEGETLADRLSGQAMPVGELLAWRAARGRPSAHAHENGVITGTSRAPTSW